MLDFASVGIPKIDSLSQANSKDITVRPVKEVEVVIVNKVWSIKNLFWKLRNASYILFLVHCIFLCYCVYDADMILETHWLPLLPFLKAQYSIILSVSKWVRIMPLELFFFLFRNHRGRACLGSEERLCHQDLERLLLFVSRRTSDIIRRVWTIWAVVWVVLILLCLNLLTRYFKSIFVIDWLDFLVLPREKIIVD